MDPSAAGPRQASAGARGTRIRPAGNHLQTAAAGVPPGAPISSLVREIVARGLEGGAARKRPTRVDQLLSVGAGRSKQRRGSPISETHDEALTGDFRKVTAASDRDLFHPVMVTR
jgi:hypothetical protein